MSKIPTINNTKLQISPTLKRKLQNIVLNSLQIGCPEEERHCLDDVPPINTYDCFYCYLDYPEFCLFKEDDTIRKLKQDLIVAKGRGDHYKQTLLAVAGSASLSFSSDEDDPFECKQCGRTDMKYPSLCRRCINGSSSDEDEVVSCPKCNNDLYTDEEENGICNECREYYESDEDGTPCVYCWNEDGKCNCKFTFSEENVCRTCNLYLCECNGKCNCPEFCGEQKQYELDHPPRECIKCGDITYADDSICYKHRGGTSTEENVKLQNVVLNVLQIGYPEYELDHPPRECVKCGNITYADDSICYKHRVPSDDFDDLW